MLLLHGLPTHDCTSRPRLVTCRIHKSQAVSELSCCSGMLNTSYPKTSKMLLVEFGATFHPICINSLPRLGVNCWIWGHLNLNLVFLLSFHRPPWSRPLMASRQNILLEILYFFDHRFSVFYQQERLMGQDADQPDPSHLLQMLYKPFTTRNSLEPRAPHGSGARYAESFSNAPCHCTNPLQNGALCSFDRRMAQDADLLRCPSARMYLLGCIRSGALSGISAGCIHSDVSVLVYPLGCIRSSVSARL